MYIGIRKIDRDVYMFQRVALQKVNGRGDGGSEWKIGLGHVNLVWANKKACAARPVFTIANWYWCSKCLLTIRARLSDLFEISPLLTLP